MCSEAGPASAVGSESNCGSRDRKFRAPAQPHNFHGDWSWNNFYSHSLPSSDSRMAVVSYWWKHVNLLGGWGLSSKSLSRLTDGSFYVSLVPRYLENHETKTLYRD